MQNRRPLVLARSRLLKRNRKRREKPVDELAAKVLFARIFDLAEVISWSHV